MWLFDLFGKGGKGKPPENEKNKNEKKNGEDNPAEIAVYSGMRVEVTTFDGSLLFVAKLMNHRQNQAELQQYSETELSKKLLQQYYKEEAGEKQTEEAETVADWEKKEKALQLAKGREKQAEGSEAKAREKQAEGSEAKAGETQAEDSEAAEAGETQAEASQGGPLHVRIRGYSDHEKKAVYMEGFITPGQKHTWKVESLTVARIGNERAFFRLDTDLDAVVTTFGGFSAGEQNCRMLNISVGGACILTEQKFHEGDKFLLKVKLLEDRPMSVMFCEVLRIIERDDAKYEYGCRFLELNEEDQEKITHNIFAAQLAERRKKRGGA